MATSKSGSTIAPIRSFGRGSASYLRDKLVPATEIDVCAERCRDTHALIRQMARDNRHRGRGSPKLHQPMSHRTTVVFRGLSQVSPRHPYC
jgi:hypothetical protein